MMEKIVLKDIYLLNWYGFVDVTIPVDDDLTFITGENESGKSTILDAFKYAFIGDTEFNKSSGAAKRDLKSYTRCLIDPTRNLYARSVDRYPTVYTHIALEFYDHLNHRSMVLGVVIETTSSNDVSSIRYRLDNKTLHDLHFTYDEHGKTIVYSGRKFCETYRCKQMQVNDGLDEFMNAVGLRLNKSYRDDYKRRLRNMMTYKAESRIPEFMKKFVLEDKPVDFKKLKASKKNIDQLNLDLTTIQEELTQLDEILKAFDELDRISTRLISDKVKDFYSDVLRLNQKISENENEKQLNLVKINELDLSLPKCRRDAQAKLEELTDAKAQFAQMDGQQAIRDEEKRRDQLKVSVEGLQKASEQLSIFQNLVLSILKRDEFANAPGLNTSVLTALESRAYDVSEKQFAVNALKQKINQLLEGVFNAIGVLKYKEDACNQEIT